MTAQVTLLTRVHAKDGPAADAVAAVLRGLARTVPAEPGNLKYTVHRTGEDPTVFYITERWTTAQDADRHIRRVETDPAIQRSAALMSAPPDTVRLLPLDTTPTTDSTEGPA